MGGTDAVGTSRPPRAVVLAALGVLGEGAVVLAVAGLFVADGVGVAVWGFVALVGVGLVVVAAALLRGQRGARGPALVAQLLVLGCAFYAAVPSGRPEWGVPVALAAALLLYGLLCRPARAWVES